MATTTAATIANARMFATNATTTGPASNSVSVTPNIAPFALTGVVSRKTHAGATFDLPIDTTKPVTGAITVEPRLDNTHRIAFQFNKAPTFVGVLTVTDASGAAIGSGASSISGNEVIVTLTGVDDRRIRVAISGVSGSLSVAASIGFLGGDENMSGAVTASDLLRTKGRIGQALGASTYPYDVSLDAAINNNDLLAIESRAGKSLQ